MLFPSIKKICLLDGATGTELAAAGMPAGVPPELWCLDNPEKIVGLQKRYIAAGSRIIYTPTFGANRVKLAEAGREKEVFEINRELARLSGQAVKGSGALYFGDISSAGLFVEPFGELPFDDMVTIYREQIRGLLAGGVQGLVAETLLDIQEARAVLLAAKELCDLPVFISLTLENGDRTLTGTLALSALVTVQSMGAAAFGCNCSTGPEEMTGVIRELKKYASIPLLAKPNAGLPRLENGRTVFSMGAEEFAGYAIELAKAGANFIGGCCGTSPEFISCCREKLSGVKSAAPVKNVPLLLASASSVCEINPAQGIKVIGERINPTGKKVLQAEYREGKLELAKKFAAEQEKAGADILDVNCGVPGVDEKVLLRRLTGELCLRTKLPLCIDSSSPEAVEAALRLYPGRALLNSIPAETAKMKKLLPLAKRYGAAVIALPLDNRGIPETAEKRWHLTEKILRYGEKYGISRQNFVVDVLVMAAAADGRAPQVTLESAAVIQQHGLPGVCGLSNVSFGLPERSAVNGTMLSMLAMNKLSLVIANPSDETVMKNLYAANLLTGCDAGARRYTSRYGSGGGNSTDPGRNASDILSRIKYAVIDGDSAGMPDLIAEALKSYPAQEIIDLALIPGINTVGDYFEKRKYFLPQLILSADAMRRGFDELSLPLSVSRDETGNHPALSSHGSRIVLATVEGDVHDIGKNLVGLMLKNYGFEVIDLGKNVSAAEIIAAAMANKADIIGLSALMTTTMPRMKEVVDALRREQLPVPVMIGGAAVDGNYASSIGAYYSPDAVAAVKLAEKLIGRD